MISGSDNARTARGREFGGRKPLCGIVGYGMTHFHDQGLRPGREVVRRLGVSPVSTSSMSLCRIRPRSRPP